MFSWLKRIFTALTWCFEHLNGGFAKFVEKSKSWRFFHFAKAVEPVAILAAILALFVTIVALFIDLKDRQGERAARSWQLLTTTAPGNSGKIEALEYLNRQAPWYFPNWLLWIPLTKRRISLTGIDLTPPALVDPWKYPTKWEAPKYKSAGQELRPARPMWQYFLEPVQRGHEYCPQFTYLPNVDLDNADLSDATLMCSNLARAHLGRANLEGINLRGANLRGANLGKAKLQGADLWGANLRGANLNEANLQRSVLRRSILSGTQLGKASLLGSDIREANLRGANLKQADLRKADFRGANLQDADLREADLQEADLRETGSGLDRHKMNCHQLQIAKNWEKAYREEVLACGADRPDASQKSAFFSSSFDWSSSP